MSTGLIFKRTTYIHVVILAQRLHYNDVLGFSPKLIIRDIYIYIYMYKYNFALGFFG